MRTKLVAANNQLALFQDSINNLRIRVNAALYQNTLLEMNNSQITSRYNAARVTIGIVRDSVRTLQGQLATCSTNDGSSRVSGGSTTTVQSQTLKLMVHPNPAGSMLYITDEYAGIVEIYDLQGTLWLTSTRNDINISTLPAGIYVVKAGEKSAKVVKQ
jgi:hypothetical protein